MNRIDEIVNEFRVVNLSQSQDEGVEWLTQTLEQFQKEVREVAMADVRLIDIGSKLGGLERDIVRQQTLDEVVGVLEGMVEHTKKKIQERGGNDWRRGKKAGLKRAITKIKEMNR